MPTIKCRNCVKNFYISPSRVGRVFFCSRACYSPYRDKKLVENGRTTRFYAGNERPSEWTQSQRLKVLGSKHPGWKGNDVSYRGLHQWVMRTLGKPTSCKKCGVSDDRPRFIQWANVDGKYRRNADDFIPLCVSCHKFHDIAIAKMDS